MTNFALVNAVREKRKLTKMKNRVTEVLPQLCPECGKILEEVLK